MLGSAKTFEAKAVACDTQSSYPFWQIVDYEEENHSHTEPATVKVSSRSSFPWYDLPCVQGANDLIWRATELPGEYDRPTPPASLWDCPDLLVTQACGLDLHLSNAPIQPVAAPVFDLDCEPGTYYSHIIGNPSGRVAAVNSMSSRSGLSSLLTVCEPDELLLTGSHVSSLEMVQSGQADVAAIDAVTWTILERNAPHRLEGVEVVDRTTPSTSPPFVVACDDSREEVLAGLSRAMGSPDTTDARTALCLEGLIPVEKRDYTCALVEYRSIADKIPAATRIRTSDQSVT